MGTWQLQSDTWACAACGGSTVREHHEVQCCEGEHVPSRCPGMWTSRRFREVNPSWTPCKVQHLLWSPDDTWMTCAGCGRDLSDDEVARVNAHKRTIDGSKMVVHEDVGVVVVNDYSVARVSASCSTTGEEQ